ncbi:P-loop NTPase fold protein [Wocania ichthyoenteri]|uniref:P-loop NTPase fold protein n=1 Tax=Wocania ichthyoenteri TaxID=1230531 RepID=UPI00053E4CFE|nr:P-loop NTPase fold protein [Wocania ichthyoenteri]
MESKKIESIFEDYLNNENTNYALMISGKWGSGKTYLWKNVLEKKAVEQTFRPVYISLNGIESVKEAESILFGSLLPISKNLQSKGAKTAFKIIRNTANVAGKIFGRGTQLIDFAKGIKIDLDVSKVVLCFDDLERCAVEPERILGLINEYTEHKNAKVIIFSAEEEIDDESDYNRIKEKVVGRILNYTANYNELFNSYVENVADSNFSEFLASNEKPIIHFFKNHNIQNLRTFGFYLENLNQLYKYYKDESETEVDRMLFFTALISNEFKNGELTITNLEDKKGIDDFMLFIDLDDVVNGMIGTPIKSKDVDGEEKSYSEKFIDKYLSSQNEKDRYVFSNSIYEFVLTGYLDEDKLKHEINTRNGKSSSSKEENAYNTLMGYNFRVLENDELEKAISEVLDYAEKGKYKMYSYQTIFSNLTFHIKIGSLDVTEEELITLLLKGLDISKTNSEVNISEISHIMHFRKKEDLNDIENKILELHNEKRNNEKYNKANKIFEVIDQELVEVDDFFNEVINSENCLFEFIDPNSFFNKMIGLKNKNLLVFSNALFDRYKKGYLEFPEKELPFFETQKELITNYSNQKDLKNPKKVILEELLVRIDEIINRFNESIERKNN